MSAPARINQYIAAVGCNLGGFGLGTAIGWSSPAASILENDFGISQDGDDMAWISSVFTLGAAAAQVYMALTLDKFGRRLSMLILAFPFVLGWLVLAFSTQTAHFLVGRFIAGFCGGAFCVAAPTYIGEISDKGIRGSLGVCFQLLLVIGILTTFCLGELNSLLAITVPLCIPPILLFVIMLFLPESPVFLYVMGKTAEAKTALQFYRGKNYDVSEEIAEIEKYTRSEHGSFWEAFRAKACKKGFTLLMVINVFQQISGINVVMFYAHNIFTIAGSHLSAGISAIILGIVQVIFTTISAALIDKFGRRILWMISLSVMGACLFILGGFFIAKDGSEDSVRGLGWIPLFAVCLYLAAFSLGTGPLPFVMLGEILPASVKGPLSSVAIFTNWTIAFFIVLSFPYLRRGVGAGMTFITYGICCFIGVTFVITFLLETKNKTLEEIQRELGS